VHVPGLALGVHAEVRGERGQRRGANGGLDVHDEQRERELEKQRRERVEQRGVPGQA